MDPINMLEWKVNCYVLPYSFGFWAVLCFVNLMSVAKNRTKDINKVSSIGTEIKFVKISEKIGIR